MRMVIPAALVVLAACAEGPVEETLVDELRVVAAVAEPPEVGVGEEVRVQPVVADPQERGGSVLTWVCTPAGEGCLEASGPMDRWLHVGRVESPSAAVLAPTEALAPLTLAEDVPTTLWVLACEDDLCPVMDLAEADLASGAPSAELEAWLADPFAGVSELPLVGVSLAVRSLTVTSRPVEARNTNPRLMVEAGELELDPGADTALVVTVEDAEGDETAIAYGLATAGGFGLPGFLVQDGSAVLQYYAPEFRSEVGLYVVVDDGRGGTAVWEGRAEVR